MSIKRYTLYDVSVEYPEVEWVRYEDHAEVERRCARLTEAFLKFRFLLDMPPESDENMLVVLARLKNDRDRMRAALRLALNYGDFRTEHREIMEQALEVKP